MDVVVLLVGLSHPHAEMYLETLEALEDVSGVVLVDPDEAARRSMSRKTRKLRAACADLEVALSRSDVSHVLVALPNASTPGALVQAIEAGKSVFTEKPAAVRGRIRSGVECAAGSASAVRSGVSEPFRAGDCGRTRTVSGRRHRPVAFR